MEELSAFIAKYLPKKRYEHSLRVAGTASELGKRYGANLAVVETAGVLHDVCKTMTPIDLENEGISSAESKARFYDEFPSVWHAVVGPHFVQAKAGISNPAIFDAIYFHTTGKADMSLETQIVYVADFIEPERSGTLANKCRKLAAESLDFATFAIALSSIQRLAEKSRPIHPDSVMCFNYYYLRLSKKDRKELIQIVEKA